MAILAVEGTLWIDLADVWIWLESLGIDSEKPRIPQFSVEEDGLLIGHADASSTDFVDASEFWRWVIENHLPAGLAHYETVFGAPKVDASEMIITFAAGENPRTWTNPPACLAEWHS